MKIGDKFILFSQIRNRGNDVGMCDDICEEGEGNRDNDVCMCDVFDREKGNDIMCVVVINIEAYMENNLQRESFSSLFKLFRVIFFVYKFEEKLKHQIKIKIKM